MYGVGWQKRLTVVVRISLLIESVSQTETLFIEQEV